MHPWTEEPARLQSMGSLRVGHDWATSLSLFTFMHWRRKCATHSSVLAWRIPGTGEPGGLPSVGSHRVGHDWSDLAAAAAAAELPRVVRQSYKVVYSPTYPPLLSTVFFFESLLCATFEWTRPTVWPRGARCAVRKWTERWAVLRVVMCSDLKSQIIISWWDPIGRDLVKWASPRAILNQGTLGSVWGYLWWSWLRGLLALGGARGAASSPQWPGQHPPHTQRMTQPGCQQCRGGSWFRITLTFWPEQLVVSIVSWR